MKAHVCSLLLLALSGCPADRRSGIGPPGAAAELPASAPPAMGINLNWATERTAAWVFVDLFRLSRLAGGFPWEVEGGPPPPLDADGYPIGLAEGQRVSTLCAGSQIDGHYPGGEYVVLFEGDGEVALGMDAEPASLDHEGQGTARFTAQVKPSDAGIEVVIRRSNPANHVRNLRVIMPGFEATHTREPFHPMFLERLRPFQVIRFMDWGATNGSSLVEWEDRRRPSSRSQSQHDGKGMAFDWMLELSHALGADPWLCVPHQASDDFVRRLATLVRDELGLGRRVYVEYSNEVWNPGFPQHEFVRALAEAAGESSHTRYARRAQEMFAIFEQVLGGRGRLVRVVATQLASERVTNAILEQVGADGADLLAVGCYVGAALGASPLAEQVPHMSDAQLVELLRASIEQRRGLLQRARLLAGERGLSVVAYEGGQHLAGLGTFKSDDALNERFDSFNRSAGMGQVYRALYAMWAEEGAGLFCHYGSCYAPTRHGRWGLLEFQDQDPATAPKYEETLRAGAAWHTKPR